MIIRMRITGVGRAVMTSAVVLVLAGCSGGSGGGSGAGTGGGATVTTTVTVTAGAATTSPGDGGPGPVQGGTVDPDDPQGVASAYGVTLVDPQAEGMDEFGFVGFRSPTRRIVCGVSDEDGGTPAQARCDVTDNTWKPPARPADCDLDWGASVSVAAGQGKAGFGCVGDVASDGKGVLEYGEAVLVGPILCMSRKTGVECVVTSGPKHGFTVSRSAYSLY